MHDSLRELKLTNGKGPNGGQVRDLISINPTFDSSSNVFMLVSGQMLLETQSRLA